VSTATALWVIGAAAVVTVLIKGIGPFALGGKPLSPRFEAVIALLAPALLAALVVTQVLADQDRWVLGADTAGVAVAGVLFWRGTPMLVGVAVAALVAGGLRAVAG